MADFNLIRVIGRGSYAKVLMVELKRTERIYAMKVIKKELVTDDEVSLIIHCHKALVKFQKPKNALILSWCRVSFMQRLL